MAAKLFTYMFLIIGIMILFQIAGLTRGDAAVTTGQFKFSTLTGITAFKDNALWQWFDVSGWIALALGTGIVLLGFTRVMKLETAVAAGIAAAIFTAFIADLVLIARVLYTSGAAWVGWVALLLVAPLLIGYVIALWDWVVGKE